MQAPWLSSPSPSPILGSSALTPRCMPVCGRGNARRLPATESVRQISSQLPQNESPRAISVHSHWSSHCSHKCLKRNRPHWTKFQIEQSARTGGRSTYVTCQVCERAHLTIAPGVVLAVVDQNNGDRLVQRHATLALTLLANQLGNCARTHQASGKDALQMISRAMRLSCIHENR